MEKQKEKERDKSNLKSINQKLSLYQTIKNTS